MRHITSLDHKRFASALGLRLPRDRAWWSYDLLLDACILRYWQTRAERRAA